VNAYLREISGADVTAKDFRTWAGTVLAFRALRALDPGGDERAARRNVVEAVRFTSDRLGNTPAVARRSYVHPAVLEAYLEGSLGSALLEAAEEQQDPPTVGDAREEAEVVALLRKRLAADRRKTAATAHPGKKRRADSRSG
jgi:DNA topoisomerase I